MTADCLIGLPPSARGAQDAVNGLVSAPGPTPACAGSTGRRQASARDDRAYPRLRGEHSEARRRSLVHPGLPPPARGARCEIRERRPHPGPTPACAGSTTASLRRRWAQRAYPRLRGEHSGSAISYRSVCGLPPPARGALRPVVGGRQGSRPTPACAGSTAPARWRLPECWAYPRLRGEHGL